MVQRAYGSAGFFRNLHPRVFQFLVHFCQFRGVLIAGRSSLPLAAEASSLLNGFANLALFEVNLGEVIVNRGILAYFVHRLPQLAFRQISLFSGKWTHPGCRDMPRYQVPCRLPSMITSALRRGGHCDPQTCSRCSSCAGVVGSLFSYIAKRPFPPLRSSFCARTWPHA